MGLTRAKGAAAIMAGAVCAGLVAMPQAARADVVDKIAPESIARVQLLGPVTVLTEEEAEAMLRAEGFAVVESERTLLGRIRILAEGPQGSREIVIHPGSGRVLRDIFTEAERPTAVIVPAAPAEVATVVASLPAETPPVVVESPVVVEEVAAAVQDSARSEPVADAAPAEPVADAAPAEPAAPEAEPAP